MRAAEGGGSPRNAGKVGAGVRRLGGTTCQGWLLALTRPA